MVGFVKSGHIYELTEIMRQKEDCKFAECLKHLAEETLSVDEIAMLKSRENFDESCIPDSCIALFVTNNEVTQYNDSILKSKVCVNVEAQDKVVRDKISARKQESLINFAN